MFYVYIVIDGFNFLFITLYFIIYKNSSDPQLLV